MSDAAQLISGLSGIVFGLYFVCLVFGNPFLRDAPEIPEEIDLHLHIHLHDVANSEEVEGD